jgi:hypothetical protein
MGDDADHHFEKHERQDQRERDREIPAIGTRAHAMRVCVPTVIVMVVIVSVVMVVSVVVRHCS